MLRRIGLFNLVGALLLVVSQRGFCADKVQFSGSLVAVTPHSVWVREANAVVRFALLPDKGAISAPSLLGRYKFGDQVRSGGKEPGLPSAGVGRRNGECPRLDGQTDEGKPVAG